jgi:hypothetical protein
MVKAFLFLTAAPYLDPFLELVHFELAHSPSTGSQRRRTERVCYAQTDLLLAFFEELWSEGFSRLRLTIST